MGGAMQDRQRRETKKSSQVQLCCCQGTHTISGDDSVTDEVTFC